MSQLTVIGSINMDVINRVKSHPKPGETISGKGTEYSTGGKGANQAVAASKSGSDVTFIGAVGIDEYSHNLISTLSRTNVNVDYINKKKGRSGMAFITVDDKGENTIVLSDGANKKLSIQDVDNHLSIVKQSNAILLQNEISWETTQHCIELAHHFGVKVYFNPAPPIKLPEKLYSLIDVIILNKSEAESKTGLQITNKKEAKKAARKLIQKGIKNVLITLGENGAHYTSEDGEIYEVPSFNVNAIDTTAAGDTFIGAFTSSIESSQSLDYSLLFASAAAALTVTRQGALISIPDKREIINFLSSHSKVLY